MAIFVVLTLVGAISVVACGSTLFSVLLLKRLRRDRTVWRLEKERFADEVWELRAAAAARDKAEAASEAKSRFLATVSHEFRTPLNGIIGMADLLQGTSLSGEQQAYVEAVRISGLALTGMIDEILDFSRIEAGRIDLVIEEVNLTALVEGVIELLAPRAHDKGLDIAALVAPMVPEMVLADGGRLRQVLLNLGGNAVKFTETGGVGIRVEAKGDGVRIVVSDTGPGVAPDRREAIFTEFEQGDNSATRRHGGTGLGLAISSRIVAHMGGTLSYEPRVECGSDFVVALTMPLGEVGSGREAKLPHDFEGRSALVVSAASFTASFVAEVLESIGMCVERCSEVASAVRHLEQDRVPHILIVDPGTLTGNVQGLLAAAQNSDVDQVITLVAPRDRHARGDAPILGGGAWLVKPVRKRSLLDRLRPNAAQTDGTTVSSDSSQPRELRRHVLLAEDNPINALIVQRSLERLGVVVTHVSDGPSALDAIRASFLGLEPSFDLVLMDVSMPGLDGLEVTRQIRALEQQASQEPLHIVALTAHALADSHHACHKAGMDEVLTKPVAPALLVALLERRPMLKATG